MKDENGRSFEARGSWRVGIKFSLSEGWLLFTVYIDARLTILECTAETSAYNY